MNDEKKVMKRSALDAIPVTAHYRNGARKHNGRQGIGMVILPNRPETNGRVAEKLDQELQRPDGSTK